MFAKPAVKLLAALATALLLLGGIGAALNGLPAAGSQVARESSTPGTRNAAGVAPGTFYGGYYTVEEMQSFLDQEVAAHPGLAEKVDFGDSWCKAHAGACTRPTPYDCYDLWA